VNTRILAVFLLLLALLGTGRAQEPSDSPSPDAPDAETFKVEEGQVRILDKFKRPYVLPRNTAWIGVKLDLENESMSPSVKEFEAIGAGGVDYEVNPEAAFVKFPLDENGRAVVRFVSFTDVTKNPVMYQVVFLQKVKGKDKLVPLSDTSWRAGDEQTVGSRTLMTPRNRAPNQTWEWALLFSFSLAGLIMAYVLFGRSLFARMLRVKRMEVTSALGYSNLLVIGGFLLVLGCGFGLFFFPKILWGKQVMIYLVVGGGCLAARGAGYAAGLVMTKA
jgi:hypothetical protein